MNAKTYVFLPAAIAAVVSAFAVQPASAASTTRQSFTQTINYHGVFSEPLITNPCTGDTLNNGAGLQFNGNLVNHASGSTTPGGLVRFTVNETGAISGVDDVTGVAYSGHATLSGTYSQQDGTGSGQYTLTISAQGSNGSAINGTQTTTFTTNSSGAVNSPGASTITCG